MTRPTGMCALALAACVAAGTADAQVAGGSAGTVGGTATVVPSARGLFERGIHALEDNRYAEAVLALEASYRVRRLPVVLYNLGLAFRGVGRYREAAEALEGYLDDPNTRDPSQRAAVQQAIESLRASLVEAALSVDPRGATVRVDGRAVILRAGRVVLDPGPHALEITAEGYRPYREEIAVEPGEALHRWVALQPVSGPAATVDPALNTTGDVGTAGHRRSVWGAGAWVGGAVAVAAGITALGLWIDGSVQASRYDARCRTSPPALDCRTVYDRTQAALDDRAAAVNIAWGVAVLGLVVLAVDVATGLLADDPPPTARRVSLNGGPGRAGVLLQW